MIVGSSISYIQSIVHGLGLLLDVPATPQFQFLKSMIIGRYNWYVQSITLGLGLLLEISPIPNSTSKVIDSISKALTAANLNCRNQFKIAYCWEIAITATTNPKSLTVGN